MWDKSLRNKSVFGKYGRDEALPASVSLMPRDSALPILSITVRYEAPGSVLTMLLSFHFDTLFPIE